MKIIKTWCGRVLHTMLVLASLMLVVSCQKPEIMDYAERKKIAETALQHLHEKYNAQRVIARMVCVTADRD